MSERWFSVAPPVRGVREGEDARLLEDGYLADASNLRFVRGRFETRLGSARWQTQATIVAALTGTGNPQLLASVYVGSTIYRVGIRQGAVWVIKEGTHTTWQATTGASLPLHATNNVRGVQLRDRLYLVDQSGGLRYLDPEALTVTLVAQPAAPSAAPIAIPHTRAVLEHWTDDSPADGIPDGWTKSGGAASTWSYDSAFDEDVPDPPDSAVVKLHGDATGAKGHAVKEDVEGEELPSNTIAFWAQQNHGRHRANFELGRNRPGEFTYPINPLPRDEWRPNFFKIGGIGKCNQKRFRIIRGGANGFNLRFGDLLLPGKLQGEYRYKYTFLRTDTGEESKPSPATDVIDLSGFGVNNKAVTWERAVKKSVLLAFEHSAAADVDKIKIYRQGGTPELTKDALGIDTFWHLATINNVEGELDTGGGALAAGEVAFDLLDATGFADGAWIVLDPEDEATREFIQIDTVAGDTINLASPTTLEHADGVAVRVAYLDNTANEELQTEDRLDAERDDPPAGLKFLALAEDGRLWGAAATGEPNRVYVSNKPTTIRLNDHHVMPKDVDPITRRSALQGFRQDVPHLTDGDPIQWLGMFQGRPTVLKRNSTWQIFASSQRDWSPSAVQRRLRHGCIAPDTVLEANGALYWVSEGPHVVRWDGEGPVEILSDKNVNERLASAPGAYWSQWQAVAHKQQDGYYYRLFYTPSGATKNTHALDYSITRDAWEPVEYYAVAEAETREGGIDEDVVAIVTDAGLVYVLDTGNDDAGVAIAVLARTGKLPLYGDGWIGCVEQVIVRAPAVADELNLAVTVGGGVYGDRTRNYTLDLAGTGEVEVKTRIHRDMQGEWVQFALSGDVANRPQIRDVLWSASPIRRGQVKAAD